jgi:hypothetical protein
MEQEVSLPYLQEPAIATYPEPDKSNLLPHNTSLTFFSCYNPFNRRHNNIKMRPNLKTYLKRLQVCISSTGSTYLVHTKASDF